MRKIGKIVILIFALVSLLLVSINAFAQDATITKAYKSKNYVGITGNAGKEYAGLEASVMLVKKDTEPSENTIGYIGQSKIDKNGNYKFEFTVNDLEFENNVVSNYYVSVNAGGAPVDETITEAKVMSDLVEVEEFDFSNFGNAVSRINSIYGLEDINYTLIIVYYDSDNRILDIRNIKRYVGDGDTFKYSYSDVPENTSYSRAFLWADTASLIPLANSQKFDFDNYKTNRSAQFLTIAPGKTSSERNFAWYDIGGVEKVRLQYVVKNAGTESDFECSDVMTVEGTCGPTDIGKTFNGISNDGINKFQHSWDYTWAKATATNLEPGKTYVYRLGDELGWLDGIYEFTTQGDPTEGFTYIVYSDEHADGQVSEELTYAALLENRKKALEEAPDAEFIIALGDNVESSWKETAYMDYFKRDKMTSIPLATVPGTTHDYHSVDNRASLFNYHFNMPNQCTAEDDASYSGYIENVGGNYWYIYGDTLIIGTTNRDGNISTYIEKAVAEAEKVNPNLKWKIWITHHPVYDYRTSPDTRNKMYGWDGTTDFVKDNGVDVVLFGHIHANYRSYPMYSGKSVNTNDSTKSSDPDGAVYICVNSASDQAGVYKVNYDNEYNNSWVAYKDTDVYGYYGNSGENYINTYFSTIKIGKDGSGNDVFEYKAYKNKLDKSTKKIIETNIVDSYEITKTK